MMQFGLIGVGAGAAAALLFASVSSGSLLSIILFYLAPLPMMIAALGWSPWAALIAAGTGALALGLVFGLMFFFAFLAGAGIPAWWLSHLAMLARPGNTNGGALEWYPPGRLVVWAAVLGALVVVVAIPNFGTDVESFRAALRDALTKMLSMEAGPDAGSLPGINFDRFVEFLVLAIPAAAAVIATITNTFNLWLAGKVVKVSGLLKRPWPQVATMQFPKLSVAALLVALGMSFLGGLTGIVAGVLSASLMMAFAILGFAVLHAITVRNNGRPFVLGVAYASVAVFSWPVLLFCLLGLIETVFNLRDRIARRRGPPPLPS